MTTDDPRPPDDAPEEPTGAPEPDAPPPPSEELRCSVCDTRLEADQTYCLECGTPTQVAPRLRRNGRAPWMIGVGLVIAGLGAGALAYAVSGDDGARPGATSGAQTEFGATSLPTDTTGIDTEFPSVSLPTDTSLTEATEIPPTEETTETTETTGTTAFVSDWPSGRTAFTAILSSVRDLAEARGTAERARSQTGESAGILFSSDHAGLTPGYYVVYSGVFTSRQEAIAQARKLASSFPGAYAKRIVG